MENQAIIQTLKKKSGKTITCIAKDLHVSRQSIYDAISGKGSRRIRIYIAITIKYKPSTIWTNNNNIIKITDDYLFSGGKI